MAEKSHHAALPEGHALHWYRIQRVLGQGAFGITYLALDVNLDRLVAIKEYMPTQLATRMADVTVTPLSEDHREDFHWGLRRFVDEARVLTRFEHRNLVRVLNVFELHGTAYMVMNYEQGESLAQVLKREKTLPEERLSRILLPLMGGLEMIHDQGFVHRDIKPGNIFIRADGSPVLLDFGSARQTRGHTDPQTLTTLVSPGYAPIEQYISKSDRQGPWTDIYGLAATMYRAVAGISPSAATDRSAMITQGLADDLQKASVLAAGKYSARFLAAIDHALAFRVEDRPQNIAAWRREFAFDQDSIDTQPDGPVPASEAITERLTESPTAVAPVAGEPATAPLGTAADRTLALAPGPVDISLPAPTAAPGRPRWQRRALIGGGLAVLALLLLRRLRRTRGEGEGGEITSAPTQPAPSASGTAAPPASPTVDAADGASPGTPDQVAALLDQARVDVEALRLTSPRGNNAYERYQAVLALDPGNADATRGLTGISQRYVELAQGAMAQGKLDDAAGYLIRAGRIEPAAASLPAAKAALAERMAAARREAEKTAKESRKAARKTPPGQAKKAVPVEERVNPPPEERVRKSLGEQ